MVGIGRRGHAGTFRPSLPVHQCGAIVRVMTMLTQTYVSPSSIPAHTCNLISAPNRTLVE